MNKTTHHTGLAWAVVITAASFFFYEFIQMNMPNAMDEHLMQAFNLNAPEVGIFASIYFWGNTLFLFPAGNLLDRFSTKKLLLSAILVCTLGTFIFAISTSAIHAGFGRFLVGVGASFCFLSCIRLASRWFQPSRMALVTGIVVTMAMLGGFVAQSPMVFLTNLVGWRHAVLLNASLGIVIFLLVLFIVQDRPAGQHDEAEAEKHHLKVMGFWRCIKLVFLNRNNWLGGIYTSLLNAPLFLLGGLWGIHYLTQVHNITHVQASYATSMFFVGVIFGSPVYGWFSDYIGRRCLPMIIGAVLSLIVVLLLMYVPGWSLGSLIFLFFLLGFVTSSQVLSYPTIAELNPLALTGTAVSIASITIMFSGVVLLPLFGWLLQSRWDQKMVDGVPFYSAEAFNHAMLIMPIGIVIGLIIAFLIRETYCESQA